MRIDSHQHFWKYNPVRDTWIEKSMKAIQKDFLPQDLKPILDANNVDGCVAVQADQSEKETEFLLTLAHQHDFIKGVVGWVDLCADNVDERLNVYSKDKKFKGIRHILQAEKVSFLKRKDFNNGFSMLAKYNLTYDILIYPQHLPNSIELVSNHRDQVFVLDHIAKPNIRRKEMTFWQHGIENIATYENVYCKISGLVTEADWKHWKEDDFKRYLDVVCNSFGIDRVLFGSDWPVCLVAAEYEDVFQIINNYVSALSEEEQSKIFGGNAIRAYSL